MSGLESSMPPLIVGLEPSVVSLVPGQETVLQMVVRGGSGSYRLPVGPLLRPDAGVGRTTFCRLRA